jgi:hypothetical protein
METINQAIATWKKQQEQLTLRLPCSNIQVYAHTDSIPAHFDKPQASAEDIKTELMKLKVRYPKMEIEHIAILAQDIANEGFSLERLKAATTRLAKNHKYQTFTLADLMDAPTVKFYTWDEVKRRTGQFPHPSFPRMKFETPRGTIFKYVSREDAIDFCLDIDNWYDDR